jgi:hypothetical protein
LLQRDQHLRGALRASSFVPRSRNAEPLGVTWIDHLESVMRTALDRGENQLYPWLFVAVCPAGLVLLLETVISGSGTGRLLVLLAGFSAFLGTFAVVGTLARIFFVPRDTKIVWIGAFLGAAAGIDWIVNAGDPAVLPLRMLAIPSLVFVALGLLRLISPRKKKRSGGSPAR